jgi:hypothetical protein
MTSKKSEELKMLIAIDHGNSEIKTVSENIPCYFKNSICNTELPSKFDINEDRKLWDIGITGTKGPGHCFHSDEIK